MSDITFYKTFAKNLSIFCVILLIYDLHIIIDAYNGVFPSTQRILLKLLFMLVICGVFSFFEFRTKNQQHK